jgi:hypothetical protein
MMMVSVERGRGGKGEIKVIPRGGGQTTGQRKRLAGQLSNFGFWFCLLVAPS